MEYFQNTINILTIYSKGFLCTMKCHLIKRTWTNLCQVALKSDVHVYNLDIHSLNERYNLKHSAIFKKIVLITSTFTVTIHLHKCFSIQMQI